ncbi:MAG TPA: hypothetical protein VGF85_10975 [Opitutaceae bacterium]|jgi:hypothetical protein
MSPPDTTVRDEVSLPLEVLSTDEENALGAVRMAVTGIRDRGCVIDMEAIVRAVVEAGGSDDGPAENGRRLFRSGSARFSVDLRPVDGGRVVLDFDPQRA